MEFSVLGSILVGVANGNRWWRDTIMLFSSNGDIDVPVTGSSYKSRSFVLSCRIDLVVLT